MTRKTDFRKMTISQRWIEIIQNPLVLFHHIYVPTKCAYRDKIWGKFHFSHMGPHCEVIKQCLKHFLTVHSQKLLSDQNLLSKPVIRDIVAVLL